jgi:hypothetical protein
MAASVDRPCSAVVNRNADEVQTCNAPGRRRLCCRVCGLVAYACSAGHVDGAMRSLAGHVVTAHPERVPSIVEQIRRKPGALNIVRRLARDAPAQLAGLMAELAPEGPL